MQTRVREMVRRTSVWTRAGERIGWLDDVVIETDTGQLCALVVSSSRWWKVAPLYITREHIWAWDEQKITVADAWAEPLVDHALAKRFSTSPSCYVQRS